MSKEDRISALPDSLIQHILCFLPSTKEAIRTSVLSKSFYNQWTRLPILKFRSYRMSFKKFSKFMDNTLLLHDCSKIQKFHINTYFSILDPTPNLNAVIDFAIKKYVEELILELSFTSSLYRLPEFLFDNASLVKLHTHNCNFDVVSCVSWAHLKALSITDCIFPPDTIENILCGSPSLESLELTNIYEYHKYVIFSKSLKKLVLENVSTTAVQISCPNLEEWKLLSPLNACYGSISINSPFLIHATIDFERYYTHPCLMLKFGSKLIQTLSNLHIGNLSSLLRKNKSLTLDNPNFEEHPDEIASALHSFHELEKLVIKLPHYKSERTTYLPNLNSPQKSYWNTEERVFNCVVSHLKTVEIIGLSESDDECSLVLSFIRFLLENATVLEKLIVVIEDSRKDFFIKVFQKLSNFSRCSQHALVELLCSNQRRISKLVQVF